MRVGRSPVLIAVGCICLLLVGIGLGTVSGQSLAPAAGVADDEVSNPTASIDTAYGRNGTDQITAATETTDGGYILVGQSESPDGDTDGWVVKVDANGAEVWNRTYGGTGFDSLQSISPIDTGGYVLAGTSSSTVDGSSDAWVIRIAADGDLMWTNRYGGSRYEAVRAITNTSDGFVLAGTTRSRGPGKYSGWVVRTNATGAESWNRTYGGGSNDIFNDITQTDSGYILAGTTESAVDTNTAWMVAIGDGGAQQWDRRITTGDATTGAAIVTNESQGYVMAGEVVPEGGGPTNALLTAVTVDGSKAWIQTYGGGGSDTATALINHPGGYAFTGGTESFATTGRDAWIVDVGSNGEPQLRSTVAASGVQTATGISRDEDEYVLAGTSGTVNSDGFFTRITPDSDPTDEEDRSSQDNSDTDSGGEQQGSGDNDDTGSEDSTTQNDGTDGENTDSTPPDDVTNGDEAESTQNDEASGDNTDSTPPDDGTDGDEAESTQNDEAGGDNTDPTQRGESETSPGETVDETQGTPYLAVVMVVLAIAIAVVALSRWR